MPALLPATFVIPLKTAKTNGLAELGAPITEATEVKKGKLAEVMQTLEGGAVGRRFQNLRATLIKTPVGGDLGAKLVLAFEVFGDDNTPQGAPSGVAARLLAGGHTLAELPLGALFLPYGCCWFDNRFAADVPLADFAAADGVALVAAADDVRAL
jgi:hypothetical protein